MRALTLEELDYVSGGNYQGPATGPFGEQYLDAEDEDFAYSWGYTDSDGVVWVISSKGFSEAADTVCNNAGALATLGGVVSGAVAGAVASGTGNLIQAGGLAAGLAIEAATDGLGTALALTVFNSGVAIGSVVKSSSYTVAALATAFTEDQLSKTFSSYCN